MVAIVPPAGIVGDVERGLCAIEQGQALADVGQPDTGAAGGRLAEAQAGVGHAQRQAAMLDLRAQRQPAAFGLGLQPVLDGVLHQALQHHRRKLGREQAVGHVDHRVQAFFHAHLQDLEVGPYDGQFATQVARAAGIGLAHRGHARTQQRDQVLLHARRARRVGLDQVVDRGQRVEQEVRLHLGLHRRHARLDHLALQCLGFGRLGGARGLRLGLHAALVGGLDDDRGHHP